MKYKKEKVKKVGEINTKSREVGENWERESESTRGEHREK